MHTCSVEIKFTRLNEELSEIPEPKYMTVGSAGMDLSAAIKESFLMNPGQISLIPTNISMELPDGIEGQIRPRSGLALRGITVINAPGTIDCDFRGEIKIALINLSTVPYLISKGERIAQVVFNKYVKVSLREDKFPIETKRGTGSFGHTGRK